MSNSECKKCIHEKVCRTREFPSIDEILKDGCPHYKDKSLFVELPCKVGDEVYITDGIPNEVTECEITSFTVDCDGVGGFSYEPLDKLKAGFASCDCLIAEWGDTVFLTKEEAERKLREVGE